MITREQLGALVLLVQTIRPAWDTRAIRPILDEIANRHTYNGDLALLAWAAIRTAQDPTKRSPAAIAFDGDHWRPGNHGGPTAAERAETRRQLEIRYQAIDRCDYCDPYGRLPGDVLCYHDAPPDQRAAAAAAHAAQARANIRTTIDTTPEQTP